MADQYTHEYLQLRASVPNYDEPYSAPPQENGYDVTSRYPVKRPHDAGKRKSRRDEIRSTQRNSEIGATRRDDDRTHRGEDFGFTWINDMEESKRKVYDWDAEPSITLGATTRQEDVRATRRNDIGATRRDDMRVTTANSLGDTRREYLGESQGNGLGMTQGGDYSTSPPRDDYTSTRPRDDYTSTRPRDDYTSTRRAEVGETRRTEYDHGKSRRESGKREILVASRRHGESRKDPRATGVSMNPYGVTSASNYAQEYDYAKSARRNSSSDSGKPKKWISMALDPSWMSNWKDMFGKMRPRWVPESERDFNASIKVPKYALSDDERHTDQESYEARRLRIRTILVIVVLLVILLAVAITVPVVLTTQSDDAKQGEQIATKYSMEARVTNTQYNENMANSSSEEFKTFENEFCQEVARQGEGQYNEGYGGCHVTSLSNGSVIVVFTIVIISPQNSVPSNTVIVGLFTASVTTDGGTQVSVLGAFQLDTNSITVLLAVTVASPSAYNTACTTEGSTTQCTTTGAVCSTSKLCTCANTQYYNAVQDTCLDKLIYNTSCPVEGSATECKTSAANCVGGLCLCPTDKYYLAADDQCLVLIDFDGACTIADSDLECKTSAAMCTDTKCKCPVDMYHDTTNDECLLKIAYNTTCPVADSATECKTSAASCIGGRCLCPLPMYYLSPDDQCLDLVNLDDTCTMTDSDLECKTSAAVCTDQICQCPMTMYPDTSEDACLLIDCGTPPDLTNGNIVLNGDTKYEDTATVTCDEGHTLVPDEPTLTCQTHDTWGDLPQCEAIACETFNFPDNSIDTSDDNSRQIEGMLYGETFELECDSGYILLGGSSTQSCGTDGQWDATTCESSSITCEPLPVIENSVLSDVSDSSITVSCNEGYTLSGNEVISCDSTSRSWSDSPSCTIVDCGPFADVSNGETIGTSTTYKSAITINCDSGYKPIGESTVSCLASGDWSSETTCTIKDCGEYTFPEHAAVTNEDLGTQYNTMLTIACDEGYTTTDDTTVTCTEAEEWSASPVCMIVDCGDAVVENGHAIGDNIKTTYNENVVFECNIGYTMTGTGSINCETNGEWSTLPQCQKVTCGEVDVLDKGSVSSTSGTSFGDVTTLECNTGYILTGNAQISCLETGNWETLPTCIEVTCGNLDAPAHGSFVSTDDSKLFTLTCENGYEIAMESNTITCNDEGAWGDVGTCDPVVCASLPEPNNGQVSTTNTGQVYENEITITCDTGYIIEKTDQQEVISRCQANKTWSYNDPCVIKHCHMYELPTNAKVTNGDILTSTEFGTNLTTTCEVGYEPDDNVYVICQANNTWTHGPTCNIKHCDTYSVTSDIHDVADTDKTEYGTNITVSCVTGYETDDPQFVVCQDDKLWSTGPTCSNKHCEAYTTPDNAAIENGEDNTEFDSVIILSCNDGYETSDSLEVTCGADATWSISPNCTVKNCPTFTAPEFAVIDIEGENTEFGTSITLSCDEGYETSDSLDVTCQADATWSTSPACTIKNCPTFTVPDNATIVDGEGNTDFDSEITIACNDGYDSDDLVVKCQADKTWSASPRCVIRFCPTFTAPANAKIESGQGNIEFDSQIIVACNKGYETNDLLVVKCQANKTWSPNPTCNIKNCPNFIASEFVAIESGEANTEFGTSITLSCGEGYETSDSLEVTCQANATWSTDPTCTIKNCPTFTAPEFVAIKSEEANTEFGTSITLSCNEGYETSDPLEVTCQANATWSPNPTCTIKNCPAFTQPEFVTIESEEANTEFGTSITLSCNEGYETSDPLEVTCQANATWSTDPTCTINNCPVFTPTEFVTIESEEANTEFGTSISLSCNEGYETSDPLEVTCQANATWSPNPTCTTKNCPAFTPPEFVTIESEEAKTEFGTSITLSCNEGYETSDSLEVTCQANATWSPNPTCTTKNCPAFTPPEFVTIESEEVKTEFGTSISLSCNEGYETSDSLEVTCQANATWSPNPTCTIKNCPAFTSPEFVTIESEEAKTEFGTSITLSCNEGYETSDYLEVTCQANTEWSASPSCSVIQCETYIPPNNAFIIIGDGNTDFGDAISVSCNEGYETSDVVVIECRLNKTWSESPLCSKVDCGPLADIANGTITLEDDTLFDTTATISCDQSYTLSGKALIKCLSTGFWEAVPTCVKNDCGEILPPNNGEVVAINSTHFNISCDNGYSYNGENIICLPDGNWTEIGTCDPIDCNTLMTPENGMLSASGTGLMYAKLVNISCDEGYLITGIDGIYVPNIELSCFANGSWAEGLTCDPYCEPLEIVNGLTNNSVIATVGSTTSVSCDTGYQLEGSAIVMCLSNGMWDEYPICNIVDCGTYEIKNGNVESPETTYGNKVTLTCHNGYNLQGSDEITCLDTGSWDDTPNCSLADCGEPPNDANGEWMYSGTKYNDTASINCNVGTQLVDNPDANLFCSENGTWVGTLYCFFKDCGDLNPFENGDINYLNGTTTYLSMVQITCDSGFHAFNGEDTATCGKEGNWSTEPGCTNVGTVSVGSSCYDFTEGDTGQITCDIAVDGWGTSGIFAVSDDGKLNPIITITQSGGTFNNQSILQHVTLNPSSVLSADSASLAVDFITVLDTDAGQYMCGAVVGDFESAGQNNSNRDNFIIFIQGNPMLVIDNTILQNNTQAMIQCMFEAATDSLQSVKIQIKYKDESTFLDISGQTTPSESQAPCTKAYIVSETFIATDAHHESEVKCVATLTDATEFTSEAETLTLVMPVDCGDAPADVNGVWTYSGTEHNDTANITCNVGTELDTNSDDNLVCSDNGIWVGTVVCVLIDCSEFPIPANSVVSYTNGTTYLSVVQISCDDGYNLFSDEDTVICSHEGNWSGDPGCTNVGTVTVGLPCYSFTKGETGQITCDVAVVGWGTTGIFAISPDAEPLNPIIVITQTNGMFDTTPSQIHVSLNPSSVLAADSASIIVDFIPVLATDAGQYMCGAVVGDFESAGQNNSNLGNFAIFIQGDPMLVIDNTTLENNTQSVIQCTFESVTDSLQSLQIQIKYKDTDNFDDITDLPKPVESQTPCTKGYTVSATFIATDAHHEADVKCVATLTDTTELTSVSETLTLAITESLSKVEMSLTVTNVQYTEDLADPTSTAFINQADSFCSGMDDVYMDTPGYQGCDVTSFGSGSLIVNFVLIFISIDQQSVTIEVVTAVIHNHPTSTEGGVNVFVVGIFNLDSTAVDVTNVIVITPGENPLPTKVDFGSSCTREGSTVGCITYEAICTNSLCVCPSLNRYDSDTDACLEDQVVFSSTQYSFEAGCTGIIRCSISAIDWQDISIIKINTDASVGPHTAIVNVNQDNGDVTWSTIDDVIVDTGSQFSANGATLDVLLNPVIPEEEGQYACMIDVADPANVDIADINYSETQITVTAHPTSLVIEAPTQLYESLVATATCSAEISRGSLGELNVQTKALNKDQFVTETEGVTVTTTSMNCYDLVTKIWSFSADTVENGTDVRCLIENNSEASESSDFVTMYTATSYVTIDFPAYTFEIGTTESIVCDILNIVGMHSILLTRSAAEPETVIEITNLADGTPTVTTYFDNIQVDTGMTTYKENGAHVVVLFSPVKCSEADADSNESVYTCAALDINNNVIKSDASTIVISKLPEVVLDFPVQIREDRWTLNIGCDAVLGLPRRDLTFLLKRADESIFSPYIPEVLKPVELRWINSTSDDGNDCVENVRYEFDMDTVAEVWQDIEIRCAVGYGTDNEVLSEIGVFQVVPKSVCEGLPADTFVAHPFDCTLVVQCRGEANKAGEWAYIHPTTCSNGECWISGTLDGPECGITTTTTTTTPAPSTTPAPGTPYITCTTDVQAVNVGQSAAFECDLRDIAKVTQLVITNTAGDEIHNETNEQGIVGDVSVSDGVSIVNINAISTVLMASFGNVFCELGDTYTIQINGVTEDDINLHVLADPGDVNINMPSIIITNGRSEITCDADVGVDVNGQPVAILSIEHKLDGQAEFVPVNTGLNTSVNYENCQNTETLSFVFYADQTWANALVRCVLRSVNSSEIKSASVESGVTLTAANVFFEQTEVSQLIDEAVILKCVANGIDGLAKLEITRDETRVSIASLLADGSTSSVDGVTVVTDKTDISDNDGTLEIQFTATCETKGRYYCTATGSDSPPETLAYVTVTRKPKIESLSLSIGWIENRYQFKEHTTNCVAEIGYPLRTVYLEANIGGQVQQLASKTPTNDAEQNCGNVVTLTYAHPDLVNSTWEGATLTCRVAGGDDQSDAEVSDVVHVVKDTFCDDEQPGESNKLVHPYACSAWLTCNRDDGTLDTCTTEVPCYAVPYPICKLTQCYDWSSLQCYTQTTTTSTTTTTTTTTTPAPGTPFITCTTNLNTVYDGDSAQFECTLRDIAIVDMLKITNQDGIDLYNQADDQAISGTLTDDVSQVTLNGDNTLLTFTFNNVNCEQVGVYTIQINNVTSDDVTLNILADSGDVSITMPSVIITNGRTEITCAAGVGVDVEGRPVAILSIEHKLDGQAEFVPVNTGPKTSFNYENCQNTETLSFVFYADQTWANSLVRCVLRSVDSSDIKSTSDESGVTLTAANVVFEQTDVSKLIDEAIILKCAANGIDGLAKLEITRGETRDNIAYFMADGSTSSVDGVTIETDNTDISDNDGTLEIQFTATCENKGSYYCTATGSDSPPETVAFVTITRQPTVESLSLSIGWIENRFQFAEHPTKCVAEVGYPSGTVYLESNIGGQVQQLASETPNDDAEQNCGNVVTLTYAHPDLIDSTWEGATITCRVSGGDNQPDVEVSDVVNVVTDTFCDDEQPGESNKLVHPYACSAWLTCNRDNGPLDTCTTEDPCYAVPWPVCIPPQCYDWSSKECYTQSTTTSTTTTTTTTTTPAPGTPFITCTTNLNTVYDGDSAQFECTLRDIAIMSMLKITNQNGIELYNVVADQGISGPLTGDVSQVTINGDNTLLTFTFTNVNCEQVGVYTIQINNVTSDDVTLNILAYEMTPTLTLPSEIKTNSQTEITCIGEVGLNAEGETIAELSFEVQFPDSDFQTYLDGVNKTLEDEKCNPIEKIALTFYPDATWNSALIRCVSTNVESEDRTMSADSTIMLQTADVLFENTQLSYFIGETVTMRCLVSNVADLERIEISRGDDRINVATFLLDGSITNAEDVTTIPDNTHITTDSTSSLEIEFIGKCGDKGQYYCKAVGSSTPPETLATLEIKRKPTIQSFELSIGWVDKRYQFANQPTVCVVELGYPKGSVLLESDKDGDFQELLGATIEYTDNDDVCSSVASVQYGYGPLMDLSWNDKMIRCRVDNPDALDSDETVSETKTVNVIPETFCSGTGANSQVEHPYACYAWLTCVPKVDSIDTCSGTDCYAVPLALCATNQCLDIASRLCSTVSTTTSTTTTTTTTTTTAPGSPSIQCSDLLSPTGENENIECTLNNIARTDGDIFKVMQGIFEILDTQTNSGTTQGTETSYDVAPSLNIVIDGLTLQLQFGPLLCDQSETYTVQYLSNSEAEPVQGSGDLTITADAQAPSISTSPAEFYRGQEIVIMCIGNLGNPEGTTDIELKSRSSADGTFQAVAITSNTVFSEDVCANDKTLSHSLYVTDNNAGSQYICETTRDDGSKLTSDALTVAIVEPVISISDLSTAPEIGNAYTMSCVVTTDVTITGIAVRRGQTTLSSWSSGTDEITNSEDGIEGLINQAVSESTFSVTFAAIACNDDGEYFCEATQGDGGASNLKTRTFLTVTQTPVLKLPSGLVADEQTSYEDTLDCSATTVNLEQGSTLKLQIFSADSGNYEDFNLGEQVTPVSDVCSLEKISYRNIIFTSSHSNVNVRCATFGTDESIISFDEQTIRLIEVPANCTLDAAAYYEHPWDCYQYLLCTGGRLFEKTCEDTSLCPIINVDNTYGGCSSLKCNDCPP